MNGFENFLKDNRQRLNREVDSDKDLWSEIEFRLHRRKQHQIRFITGIAASLAIIIALTAIVKVSMMQKAENSSNLPLYAYSKAYGETEFEYLEAISYQTQLINQTNVSSDQVHRLNSYLTGLKALNEAYDEYNKIIKREGCNEIMMQLVIDNYKRRIELLQSLRAEIQKINSYENNNKKKQTTLSL